MTNYEYYKEEIKKITGLGMRFAIDKNTKEVELCADFECSNCLFTDSCTCSREKFKWAYEEHIKSGIDWSKVPIDTKIWVKDAGDYEWFPRHFAKYDGNLVYTWKNGTTSFSGGNSDNLTGWQYARLKER